MSNVRDFGAQGNARNDDTAAIEHALRDGDGTLQFPPGDYLISRTIVVELQRLGRFSIEGTGGAAKLIMSGPGSAFHLFGSHAATADPQGFEPGIWSRQRMPTVTNIEIEGRHPEASGFLVEGTMQSSFQGVLLRKLLDGIRVFRRARNVLISHCHIYDNRGIGVFLDRVNLHQAIITGSHISYCRRAGIKIAGSEIRNIQITGNDIEYNYDVNESESADIWIDSTADGSSVREGTISSNTIQAKVSPGGANIRMVGLNPEQNHKAGMFSISGNLIGSQETNVHLVACRGVIVGNNFIYSAARRNVLVEGSRHVVLNGNCFEHNPDYKEKQLALGVRIFESRDCTFSGSILQDSQTGQPTVDKFPPMDKAGLLEIVRSQRVNVNGCQILDGTPTGIHVEQSDHVAISGCTIVEPRADKLSVAAIRFKGPGRMNFATANTLQRGTQDVVLADAAANVKISDNLVDG